MFKISTLLSAGALMTISVMVHAKTLSRDETNYIIPFITGCSFLNYISAEHYEKQFSYDTAEEQKNTMEAFRLLAEVLGRSYGYTDSQIDKLSKYGVDTMQERIPTMDEESREQLVELCGKMYDSVVAHLRERGALR